MEDETVMNDLGGMIETTGDNVYLSVNIGTGNGTTKAATTGSANDADYSISGDLINRCILYLLDGDKVLAVTDTILKTEEGADDYKPSLEMKFLTKVSKNPLKLVAVVNYDGEMRNDYFACSTLTQLENIRETRAGYRVLVGEINNISLPDGDPSTTNAPTKNVGTITVTPRVACIDLTSFNVRYKTTKHPEVKLTGIYYNNLKKNVGLFVEGDNSFETEWQNDLLFPTAGLDVVDNGETGDCNNELRENKSFFVAFPNTDEDTHVQMRIDFTVDGEKYSRTYIINRPFDPSNGFVNHTETTYVRAGYWYRLSATVNISSDIVDCDVVCYTRDWNYNLLEDVTL